MEAFPYIFLPTPPIDIQLSTFFALELCPHCFHQSYCVFDGLLWLVCDNILSFNSDNIWMLAYIAGIFDDKEKVVLLGT